MQTEIILNRQSELAYKQGLRTPGGGTPVAVLASRGGRSTAKPQRRRRAADESYPASWFPEIAARKAREAQVVAAATGSQRADRRLRPGQILTDL